MTNSREVRLKSRPDGTPKQENFTLETVQLAEAGSGAVKVTNNWMSVDPYMRPRMLDKDSYVKPFELGKVLEGGAIGTVEESNDARFKPGDVVLSNLGWREAFVAPAEALRKVDPKVLPAEAYLGIAGMPGLTAYIGITAVLKIKAGEFLFVSAASGAVGSAACQIAKIKGATVIGSAGGEEKCAFLREIGVDHVIDYKAVEDFTAALKEAAPNGIDCCFDNVGGSQLGSAIEAAKPFARLALCGMVSQYNGGGSIPADFFNAVRKRLTLQGFIVSDHHGLREEFLPFITQSIQSGEVKWRQTVDQGIEQAVPAFLKLFAGDNFGKMIVKLG